MPTATAPLGKPAAAAKPGFSTKPTLSRQTGAPKEENEEEEVDQGPQPVHIAIASVALLLSLLFVWTVYQGDQVPNRVSDYMLGQPSAADDSSAGSYASDSNSDNDSDDEDEDEDEEDDD